MRTPREVVRRFVRRRKHRRDKRAQAFRSALRNMRKDFQRWRRRQLHFAIREMWARDGARDERGKIIHRGGKFSRDVLAWLS